MNWDRLSSISDALESALADRSLDGLLPVMDLAFEASTIGLLGDFHKNIENFEGRYLFEAKEGSARSAAIFEGGDMRVLRDGTDRWDVKVVFRNDHALMKFMLKGVRSDALDAMMDNDVQVYGNINYLLKFGYMARDLLDRFGLV